MRRSYIAGPIFALALLAVSTLPPATAQTQEKKKSPSDLNAIGYRNISGQVNFYSKEKEIALGKALAQEVEKSSRLVDDLAITEYVNRIGENVAKNSDAKFAITIRVIDSDKIDAFTLPGGYQYVNRGLILASQSEAELAGVIAYGIAHTALRSETRLATKAELTQLSSIPVMISTPYSWAGCCMYKDLNVAIPATFLKFSRDAARAADFYAVQYLYKAGYSAEAYPQFLERALPQAAKVQNTPKVFSTLPPLPERLQALKEEISRLLPPHTEETVSSPAFEAVKERLRGWQAGHLSDSERNPVRPTLRKPPEKPSQE